MLVQRFLFIFFSSLKQQILQNVTEMFLADFGLYFTLFEQATSTSIKGQQKGGSDEVLTHIMWE